MKVKENMELKQNQVELKDEGKPETTPFIFSLTKIEDKFMLKQYQVRYEDHEDETYEDISAKKDFGYRKEMEITWKSML